MSERGTTVEKFSTTSFLLRAAFALALVLLTYNPSGYSYVHLLQDGFPKITPVEAVAGILLLIGWFVFLGATLRSIGVPGMLLSFLGLGHAVRYRRDPLGRARDPRAHPGGRHVVVAPVSTLVGPGDRR